MEFTLMRVNPVHLKELDVAHRLELPFDKFVKPQLERPLMLLANTADSIEIRIIRSFELREAKDEESFLIGANDLTSYSFFLDSFDDDGENFEFAYVYAILQTARPTPRVVSFEASLFDEDTTGHVSGLFAFPEDSWSSEENEDLEDESEDLSLDVTDPSVESQVVEVKPVPDHIDELIQSHLIQLAALMTLKEKLCGDRLNFNHIFVILEDTNTGSALEHEVWLK